MQCFLLAQEHFYILLCNFRPRLGESTQVKSQGNTVSPFLVAVLLPRQPMIISTLSASFFCWQNIVMVTSRYGWSFLFLCLEWFHYECDQAPTQVAQTGRGVSILGMVLDMVLGNWVQVVLLEQQLDKMTSRILPSLTMLSFCETLSQFYSKKSIVEQTSITTFQMFFVSVLSFISWPFSFLML